MKGMLVGAALAIGGMLVGFAFATKTDVLAEAKWWDLMTAFGTVGAVVSAIYFSRREASQRQRLEGLSAEIAHARITPELRQLKIALSPAVWSAKRLSLVEEGDSRNSGDIYFLTRLVDSLTLPLSSLKCESLLPARPDRARQLSEILGEAVRLKAIGATVVGFGETQPNGGGISTFILLERICELGTLVEQYQGETPTHEFKLETFRSVARKLGIEAIWEERLAQSQQVASRGEKGE